MTSLEQLWAEYGRRPRPPDIGDTVDGARLGQLDDDVQDVLGSLGMGPDLGLWRVAKLGRALAEIERVLPKIESVKTREYFSHVVVLSRAALDSIAQGDLDAR